MMKKIVAIGLFLLSFGMLHAQDNYFYLTLDVNEPLSNTSWNDATASRGFRAGYRGFINESNFSAGIDVGYTTFADYIPTRTYVNGTRSVTTDYFNYVYNMSAVISGQYNFFLKNDNVVPYAGLGIGANNNQYVQYYNIYEDTDRAWGFLVRPELGVLVKFGQRRTIGAMAGIHYDYSTNKSEQFNYTNFSSVGFNIGLIFQN